MTKLAPILVYGVLAAVLLMAIYLFCLGARNVWRGLASPTWPKVVGTVISSNTSSATTHDRDTRRSNVIYSADIAFRYNVNGRDYTTQLLYFGQTWGSGDPTEAQLRTLRYPGGSTVSISYNPNDPSIAAAEPGYHAESLLLLIAGLGFGLPCIMGGVVAGPMLNGSASNLGIAIAAGLFGAVFALLGIAALTFGLIGLARAHSSVNWPTAPGHIAYQPLPGAETDQADDSTAAHLVFVYEVDRKKHYSNIRRFGLLGSGTDEELAIAHDRYPQDKAVTVSYSPTNPNLGVLEPGVESEAYALPGIGLGILLFATAVFVFIVPAVAKPLPVPPGFPGNPAAFRQQ